ncbi:MAG: F0F1 ATP synthase subunit epsilon [Nocardioidaceae bacterium]
MSDLLHVELVAAERVVWSGEATAVVARTTEGDLGILLNHAPVLSLLVEGVVEIRGEGGDNVVAAVDSGFLSVSDNRVSILSENIDLAAEIDVSAARQELERATAAGPDDEEALATARRAQARIRAAETTS